MSVDNRRRLVQRLDIIFFIGLLVTSGLAALLFWSQFDTDDEADAVSEKPSATSTVLLTKTYTSTPTVTFTLTPTLTRTPTITPSATQTDTSTYTPTPWPAPLVSPLALADTYAGEPLLIMGMAQPGDMIQLLDQDDLITSVTTGEDGVWSIDLSEGLPAGPHNLSVVAVGPGGVTSNRVPVGFDVANPPTSTPTNTPTWTSTPTNTPSATWTPTETQTWTPIPSDTPTAIPSDTATPRPPTVTRTPRPATLTATPTAISPTAVLMAPTETGIPSDTPRPPTLTATLTVVSPTAVLMVPSETNAPSITPPATTAPPTETHTQPAPTLTHTPTLTATILPSAPQINSLPSDVSILDPVVIAGMGVAGQTITLSADSTPIGETLVQADGSWSLDWQTDLLGPVEISAAATSSDGQVSDLAVVETELTAPPPRIDSPASGDVFSPGVAIPVSGTAQPGTTVEIRNDGAGTVIATAPVTASGTWEITITLHGAGKVTISAVAVGLVNSSSPSDPVTITLAPAVHPDTGGSADTKETGQAFAVLLALLLAAGGFSMYFAGRLVYTLAQDRLKPH